jgi:hypothetical protein
MQSRPATGQSSPNGEYTLLADNVAARTTSPQGGHTKALVDIVNNSDVPYVFQPTQFAAQSERQVQRLAFHPVGNEEGINSQDYAQVKGWMDGTTAIVAGVTILALVAILFPPVRALLIGGGGLLASRGLASLATRWGAGRAVAGRAAVAEAEAVAGGRAVAESTARISGMLRSAAKGKGNFGVGTATKAEAEILGKSWVGDSYKVASDGKTLLSKDGLRQYRPSTYKPRLGRNQSNLEWRNEPKGRWQGNGHVDIVD